MKKFLGLLILAAFCVAAGHGQAISQNGGAIQGTITDPSGAALPGAQVVITNTGTGEVKKVIADGAGVFAVGPLIPGNYTEDVTAAGFQHLKVATVVRVGTVTSGSEKLTIGKSTEVVEVNAGQVQINTDQIGVAGVVTSEQIDTLPINGRNILDIAQIQPGVELQSGQSFDPTKTGYSALAVNGENGRSTRILVDGQDISDETVGTTLFNVPQGAVGEFQLNRSTQDVSGSVTSTGQVLIATRSGSNAFHGNAFYNFQDNRAGFANVLGRVAPFQRNQYGGYIGGFIIKDKLFFFGGGERIQQKDTSPVTQSNAFFVPIYTQFPVTPDPFKDTFSDGRLDYNAPHGIHLFARATYSNNFSTGTLGQNPYAFYGNQDNVPALVGGADFTTGKFTHSIRFGYIKFINHIASAASQLGNTIYNPSATLGFPFELIGAIYAGSGNEDAPQSTYQSSKQLRYDGTWTHGRHSIKYGGEMTRILQGGFAAFYSTFLADISTTTRHQFTGLVSTTNPTGAGCNNVVGAAPCLADPLQGYKAAEFVLGNGNGSFSERPSFGLPGGGDFSWRIAGYVGDTFKASPSLTLVAGLRWSTDTDRANQDLATPTCGQVDPSLQFTGCDSSAANAGTPLFNFFDNGGAGGYGLGKATHQPYGNFGPQAGFVFSPGAHKLAIRGGGGIYYESDLFNNGSNARAENTQAQFPGFTYGVNNYTQTSLALPGYNNNITGVSPTTGQPCTTFTGTANAPTNPACYSFPQIYQLTLGAATTIISKLDTLYKAASAVPQPNTAFIGGGAGLYANSAYGGPYKSPYSIQLNGGVQYELFKGIVLNVDFIHNATLKVPLSIDTNHNGAARYLNTPAAQNAISATTAEYGCAGGFSAAAINCAIAAGAIIDDFAGNGLDSGKVYLSNASASANGVTTAFGAAFPGENPNVGTGSFILPVGKSSYDALQVVLQGQKAHPLPGIVQTNMQISYNLSRAVSNSGGGSNQFFAGAAPYDNDCANCYIGRNDLDNSNQISISTSVSVKYGLQVGVVGHFFSAGASTLSLADVSGGGQIFKTDVDGDGSIGDLIPGTLPGAYMHQVKGAGLGRLITNYNATAGTLTPAGQTLVTNGLFTNAQLVALGATRQLLIAPPTNPLQNSATRTLDASIKYPIKYLSRFREGLVITPGVTMYNVTNMTNFGGFSALADTTVDPVTLAASTYLNGPNTQDNLNRERVGRGTGNGTFDQGGPRSTEFSLKVDF